MERRGNWQRRWRRCKRRLSIRRCRMRRIFGWRRFTGGWGRRRRGGGGRGFMGKFRRRRKRRGGVGGRTVSEERVKITQSPLRALRREKQEPTCKIGTWGIRREEEAGPPEGG